MTSVRVVALNCSLKPSPQASSTDRLVGELLREVRGVSAAAGHAVVAEVVRVVDHDVRAGVEPDMGEGDEWPTVREKVLAADIVVMATPTWGGQPSSVCQRVLERLDAERFYSDDDERPHLFDKVALAVAVGKGDGAHHITGILWQSLSDLGFTIPPQGVTYWNSEAMGGTDYVDLDETPSAVAGATRTAARNGVHLAVTLQAAPYPGAHG